MGQGSHQPKQGPHHPAFCVVIPTAETAFVQKGFTEPEPLMITAGFRILSGAGAVNGIRVTYRANGKTKHQVFRQAIAGCVQPMHCNDEGKDPDFASQTLHQFGLVPKR